MVSQKIAVICGCLREYDLFVRTWVKPSDIEKFHRVSYSRDIDGHCFKEVVTIGEYSRVHKYYDLLSEVESQIGKAK